MSELVTYHAPTADEWAQHKELVGIVAKTDFVPKAMRGNPAAVLACVMTGREVGIGPMQSLKHIALIEGKAGMSAELMGALARRAGHKIRVLERTDERVTVEGARADDPGHAERVTWTLQDAQRAGLAAKDVWKKYPQAMLLSRAVSALARSLFPDVLAGVSYTPEELDSLDGQTVVEVGEPEVDLVTGEVTDSADGLTAERLRAEQAAATATRNGAAEPPEGEGRTGPSPSGSSERTGRDALRDRKLSANDAAKALREIAEAKPEQFGQFKGITLHDALRLTGDALAKAELVWDAYQQAQTQQTEEPEGASA
jgi:hypothetical protein